MNRLFYDIKAAIRVVAAISVASILIQFFMAETITTKSLSTTLLYNAYYGMVLSLTNGWLFDYLNYKFPWYKKPRQRILYGILGSIILTMGCIAILNYILWSLIYGGPIEVVWARENRSFYIIALMITVIITTILHAVGFFKEVQQEKKVSAKLRQEKLASELSALRSQVDPHFLFNSFNVLSGLIDEDKEKAQEFLTGLSKIYRYVLEQRDDDTSLVQDELAFARQYLRLQQMRFENSILLKTQLKENILEKRIPSLSLQLLLENAIKHNAFDEENPLEIEIREEKDQLIIQNNCQERSNLSYSNGVGLTNIKARYRLLSDQTIVVDQTPNTFTVKLPLI